MKLKSLVSLAFLSCLVNVFVSGTFSNLNAQTLQNNNIRESVIYSQVFFLVEKFNQKAENGTVESERNFFRNYFKNEALLSNEQNKILITTAKNFTDAFALTSGEQRPNLSLQYKNKLRSRFGEDEFKRFDEFVKNKIASGVKFDESTDGIKGYFSGIYIDKQNNVLHGTSDTIVYSFHRNEGNCPGTVSASMSGANVSVTGYSNSCNPNPSVDLTSTVYLPNSQYCIDGTHTAYSQTYYSRACLMPEIDTVSYKQIDTNDLLIDTNPNAGGGYRIFPDDKIPDDPIDRRKILVTAQTTGLNAGTRIYFRSIDVDDPSANTAPIDPETMPNVNTGNDNNGTVNGTANTKAGLLSIPNPNPYNCQPFTSGISCETDNDGIARVDFTTTMQPGDNFTVVAGLSDTYVNNLTLATDGINLKDTNNVQIPVTTATANNCLITTVAACRADMLTVWRRLHLEVDSMGNVGTGNNVTGTINQIYQTTCPNPPGNCTVNTVFAISNTGLENSRFDNGRIQINQRSFRVLHNEFNATVNSEVVQIDGQTTVIRPGSNFTLYDDDDYNADDSMIQSGSFANYLVDGDANEQIVQLPESFKHLLSEDGLYTDGTPRNIYASSYVKPEYNWAQNIANYNQVNLAFDLNVSADQTNNDELTTVLTNNRGSKDDERDDFWIGYFLIGYQGNENEDADGDGANPGISKRLLGTVASCDCYQSSVCPSATSGTPPPISCSVLPTGSFGSVLYQEVQQDVHRSWLIVSRTFENIPRTAPHELGHQFGLSGDQQRQTFKIMDYDKFTQDPATTVINDLALHPEHINLIRRRIKSPGQ